MILRKLTEFLNGKSIKYTVITHSEAFTAREIATIAHIPGKELAKTVLIKLDGKMTMAVVPASEMIDFKQLKRVMESKHADLATEAEFKDLFPECEVGAMPPFGNLFDLNVLVTESIALDEEIVFNAGTHRELIRMKYSDFEQLVKPTILRFSVKKKTHDEEKLLYE